MAISLSTFLWLHKGSSKGERYYSHTLGSFGQPEPEFCYETEPVGPFNQCRAASLACSSYKSWQDLKKCEACRRDRNLCQKETIEDTLPETGPPNLLKLNVP